MYTTHVGSLPLEYSRANAHKAFMDMLRIGLDYPPYPQLQNFITIFLKPLLDRGVIKFDGHRYIYNPEVNPPPLDFKVEVEEAEAAAEIIKTQRFRVEGVRGCVTGPFTLSSQVYLATGAGVGLTAISSLSNTLLSRRELLMGFMVDYVKKFIRYLHEDLKFNFIVVDEPTLSVIVGARRIMFNYTPEDFIKVFNSLLSGVSLPGLHVCGLISPLLRDILLNVSALRVLDHEFKDSPRNFNVYLRGELEDYDKYIALGCVSSKSLRVESEEEVLKFVLMGREKFGDRLLMIKPDCGFRGLLEASRNPMEAYEAALEKLKRIVSAAKSLKG